MKAIMFLTCFIASGCVYHALINEGPYTSGPIPFEVVKKFYEDNPAADIQYYHKVKFRGEVVRYRICFLTPSGGLSEAEYPIIP